MTILILLVVAAVGILWAVVQSLVSDSTGNVGSSTICLTNTFSIESAVDDEVSTTTVKIKKTQGSDEITGINFFVDGASEEATGTVPSLGETKTFTLTSTGGTEVEIAPVLGETQCPNSDKATITTAS